MKRKIVIASDSFKGSLGSAEVAAAAGRAVKSVMPECLTVSMEMADGGEGTVETLYHAFGGRMERVIVQGPLGDPVEAGYAIVDIPGKGCAAVIEMSKASGLPLVPPGLRNPMKTSTFGTGELIADAVSKGCRHFLIGIGGSATNDAGIGMLTALGWRFIDEEGRELPPVGASLEKIAGIQDDAVLPSLEGCSFMVACDVDTPFCGPDGAAYIFAPQKGADPGMVERLDSGMRSFVRVIKEYSGIDVERMSGAGAAGGLGGALKAFLHAELMPGAEMVLEAIGFDAAVRDADLVITGEGKMDSQTLKGKAPYCVLKHSSRLGVPVVAITGMVSDPEEVRSLGYLDILPINPPGMPLEEAMRPETASENVFQTVRNYLVKLKK